MTCDRSQRWKRSEGWIRSFVRMTCVTHAYSIFLWDSLHFSAGPTRSKAFLHCIISIWPTYLLHFFITFQIQKTNKNQKLTKHPSFFIVFLFNLWRYNYKVTITNCYNECNVILLWDNFIFFFFYSFFKLSFFFYLNEKRNSDKLYF